MATITIACYIYTGPPVQSASKQIGSRSHAIIPISLRILRTKYTFVRVWNSLYSLCIRPSRINPRVTTRRDNPDPETFLLLTSENIEVDSIDFRSLRNALRYEAEEILIDRDGEKCLARRYPRLSSHALLPTGHFPRPTRSA